MSARAEDFIGRRWLYRQVEDAFKDDSIGGVLIIGNPGTGKYAWASQLICSRTTSSTIHSHILGYHLCKYSDKNTQMAGKFVRNLVEMIARRLPEYGYIVSNSSYIQRYFDVDCVQNHDPVGCFEQTIITPLRNLKNEPVHNWFIIRQTQLKNFHINHTSMTVSLFRGKSKPSFHSRTSHNFTTTEIQFHLANQSELPRATCHYRHCRGC